MLIRPVKKNAREYAFISFGAGVLQADFSHVKPVVGYVDSVLRRGISKFTRLDSESE
jgi:hypothetical protein